MNLTSLITDNISEILMKIIEFTQARQKILTQNIINLHMPGFIPQELGVDEFSNLLNHAIDEHVRTQRLVFYDTENIKFGPCGDLEAIPYTDETSKVLLNENRFEYIEHQINKLWENSLNQKFAAELLKQNQDVFSSYY